MNILILEDDRLLNKAISVSLEDSKHKTCCCFNGNEALAVLENRKVDLIVADLMIPEKAGLNFLIVLQNTTKFNIPLIIISALENAPTLIERYHFNCIAFFKKPVDPDLILDQINRLNLQ